MHHDVTVEAMVHIRKQIHKCHEILISKSNIFLNENFSSCLLTLELFKNLLNFETGWYSFMLRNVMRTTCDMDQLISPEKNTELICKWMSELMRRKRRKGKFWRVLVSQIHWPGQYCDYLTQYSRRISVTILSLVTEQGFYSTKLWNNVYFL